MLYGTFYVRYTEGSTRVEVKFNSLNRAADFWEIVDDPTSWIFDEFHAPVEYEDILRVT